MQRLKSGLYRSGFIFCLLLCFTVIKAQKSIHFEKMTFDEAVEKAKSQKKIVFVDVQGMNINSFNETVDKDIFTLDSVADFFNAHIVSIRINMNSEEGKKFAPRLAMLMYPVYVFHGSNGDQLDFTNAGSVLKDPALLMAKARSSLATNNLKIANTRSILFAKDNWATLLDKAKSEDKLIFLDAQTTWCRPCIMMAKDIFTLDRVADFYNSHFINVTMDMEKGEGPSLAKKYGINAFPTFLYIDGDGKLVHYDGGYQEADPFLKNGQKALSNKAAGTTSGPKAGIAIPRSTTQTPAPSGTAAPSIIPFAGAAGSGSMVPARTIDTGMHFTSGSWAALLAQSRQTGKLIFVDANTTWCGPCKQMQREIFPQKSVSQLYNSNFINVDFDMEKGEGITFRKQYGIKAYPTFLYINGDGEVVHKTVGSCDAADFRQHGLDALSPHRNLLYLQTESKNNQNDAGFVATFLAALADAYEESEADSVAVAFLESKDPSTWQQPDNWLLVKQYVHDATSAPFLDLVKEQSTYGQRYGLAEVEKKIYQTYLAWPQHYLHYPVKGQGQLDREPFDAFLLQVSNSSYAKKAEVEDRAKLTAYFGLRDWRSYASTVDDMLSRHIIPMDREGAEWLYSFADIINRFSGEDKTSLSDAVKWTKLISYGIDGIAPDNKATYLDLYATLLEKTSQADLAGQVRKEINQQQLSDAKANMPFKSLMRVVPKQN